MLNARAKVNILFSFKWLLKRLIKEIEQRSNVEEANYLMYVTFEKAMKCLDIDQDTLDRLVVYGKILRRLKVEPSKQSGSLIEDQRKICYTWIRKLPPKFL